MVQWMDGRAADPASCARHTTPRVTKHAKVAHGAAGLAGRPTELPNRRYYRLNALLMLAALAAPPRKFVMPNISSVVRNSE